MAARKTRAVAALLIGLAMTGPVMPAGGTGEPTAKPNRLASEASPYLRQHAHNPVDWYPWGQEAFEKARRENKPILLSVGYSTCHWCHVMERESYSDPSIAEIINTGFVAIKVDRERRPDVDATYMLATELITRSGGWPNHVWLTPDLKPFMAGTYFPPMEFARVLNAISDLWRDEEMSIRIESNQIAAIIERLDSARIAAADITREALREAAGTFVADFDEFTGGFGIAPKFPREIALLFLLDLAEKERDAELLRVVTVTLDRMLDGGIHDHVGGGFHRYAVDNAWRVPHFEKMLYNQALMGQALIRAYRLTGTIRYADAARRTLDFVLADLTAPEGGFYSAYDADSEGAEGRFYLWTPEQLAAVLEPEEVELAEAVYDISAAGNFEHSNILYHPAHFAELAAARELTEAELLDRLAPIYVKLRAARAGREAPHRDEKVLAGWNGMMIAALAEAGAILKAPAYVAAAARAADFLWDGMGASEGKMQRYIFEDRSDLPATQSDYAFVGAGLIALFDATGDVKWRGRALELAEIMHDRFRDDAAGDYFLTEDVSTFMRGKERTDSALPAGNAVALDLFARLARRDGNPDHLNRGHRLLAALSGLALEVPATGATALAAADRLLRGETGHVHYFGKGTVRATVLRAETPDDIRISLSIAPGWHVNANKPLEDFLVPTEVRLSGHDAESAPITVRYPPPVRRRLGFAENELALYEGDVEIAVTLPAEIAEAEGFAALASRLRLDLQACSDEICLEPETALLSLSPEG